MSGSRRKPGPLGPFVEGYRAWLLGRGYSALVVIRSLIALGHLGRWTERQALAVDQLTAAAVSVFIAEYRSTAGGCRPRASGRYLSIYAPRAPSHRSPGRLSSRSASITSGCFASAGWPRSPSTAASNSRHPHDPLFSSRTGRRLTRDAVERRVATHDTSAAQRCPSLAGKRVHPHALRHSCAMSLLQAHVDSTVIALWLGHADTSSTQQYIHADMTIKERALALLTPPAVAPGRYRPNDDVLAYLASLG
jgi:hypothetical protein